MPNPKMDAGRAAWLKRFPELEALPEDERLGVALASRRHPLFWGALLVLLLVWMALAAPKIIELTGHFTGRADMYAKLFLPAMLPILAIFWLMGRVQRCIIKRRVQERVEQLRRESL